MARVFLFSAPFGLPAPGLGPPLLPSGNLICFFIFAGFGFFVAGFLIVDVAAMLLSG